jgi:hypothetical protein
MKHKVCSLRGRDMQMCWELLVSAHRGGSAEQTCMSWCCVCKSLRRIVVLAVWRGSLADIDLKLVMCEVMTMMVIMMVSKKNVVVTSKLD